MRRLLCSALLASLPVSAMAADAFVRLMEPAAVDVVSAKAGTAQLTVQLPGRSVELTLVPNQSLWQDSPPALKSALADQGIAVFEGEVLGQPDGWVRISRFGETWQGAWYDGETLYFLDPAADAASLGSVPKGAAYVAYRLDDLVIDGFDFDEAPGGAYDQFAKTLSTEFPRDKALLKRLTMTVVTDTEFTTQHNANRDNVVIGRLNIVDGFYTNQLQVRITLGTLRHLSDNGTLTPTNGSTLLGTFRTYMNSGAGSTIPKGGLNHLFSGKDFDGSTAGVAYVGVLCGSSGYGVNQIRSTSASTAVIVAHEMGHNFGASHDGGTSGCASGTWIMSPSVSGSLNSFSTCSLNAMLPRVASASCLTTVTTTTGFYGDGFED